MNAPNIPESVTGQELADAMQPLLDLLGVSLESLMAHGMDIDFVEGVTLTCGIPAAAGVTAVAPGLIPGNAFTEFSTTTLVKVTGPGPDLGKIARSALVAEVV